jgi:Fis family transcriptional regulator
VTADAAPPRPEPAGAERALLLPDAPAALVQACAAAGLRVELARSPAEGRRRLDADGAFALVDGRIAAPRPLDEEIAARLSAFYERLDGHAVAGLYDAVMREVERPLITGALSRNAGVRSAAAAALGIDRGTLSRRMRALGLDHP